MRTHGWVLLGACVGACAVDMELPTDAQVGCSSDAECPAGLVCSTNIGRCVSTEALRVPPPALAGAVVVSPPVGGIDRTFAVTFTVTKDLGRDPVVTLDTGARIVELTLDEAQSDRAARRYAYSYRATGAETEGSRALAISLIDTLGNAGTGEGTLRLDFTPPRLLASAITPPYAREATMLVAHFTLDEPPGREAEVVLSDGAREIPLARETADPLATEQSYALTVPRTHDGVPLEEKRYDVRLRVADEAENQEATPAVLGEVVVDFTAPKTLSISTTPDRAAAGTFIQVGVTVDELLQLQPPPDAHLVAGAVALALDGPAIDGNLLTFTRAAQPGEDGAYTIEVTGLVDLAGNDAGIVPLGGVSIDTTPPAIAPGTYWQSGTQLLASDTLTVSFHSDEALIQAPQVLLRDEPLARIDLVDDQDYVFELPVGGTGLSGTWPILVTLVDLVGNTAFLEPGSASLDTALPELVSAQFSPAVAQLGAQVLLTLTVNEDVGATLDAATALGFDTDPGFVFESRSGLNYNFLLSIDGTTPGPTYTLETVTLTDLAGNPNVITGGAIPVTLTVDSAAPSLTLVTTDRQRYSVVPGYDVVTLTFDSDEALARLDVTIGGLPFSDGCTAFQATSPSYTCVHHVSGLDDDGFVGVVVTARDGAGNVTVEGGTVVIDNDPPGLASFVVTPSPVAASAGTVSCIVTADEALGEVPALTIGGPATLAFTPPATAPYVFTYTVQGGEPSGTYTTSVTLTDEAGNEVTLAGPTFVLDVAEPVLSNLQVNASTFSRVSPHDALVVTFDSSEDVGSGLLVALDGRALDCGAFSAGTPSYTCDTTIGLADAEGPAVILVRATDAAGNLSTVGSSVQLDFTPPSIVPGSVSLTRTPPAGSPLTSVSAVTDGGLVTVSFLLSELHDVGTDPVVATSTPGVLTFDKVSSTGTAFTYEHLLVGLAHVNGVYQIEVLPTDAVGNTPLAPLPLAASFVVDTVAPTVPRMTPLGQLVYVRKPWGANPGSNPEFSLSGQNQTVEADATVVVYSGTSSGVTLSLVGATRVAQGPANGSGAFTLPLSMADQPYIFVVAIDGAGNMSDADAGVAGVQASLVREVAWTASSKGKVAGSTFENPHLFYDDPMLLRSGLHGAIASPTATEITAPAALGAEDAVLHETSGAGRWLDMDVSVVGHPSEVIGGIAVYDDMRGVTLSYDGGKLWQATDELGWVQVCGAGTSCSGPTGSARLAYDRQRDRLVLFGGAGYTETWEWNGASWTLACKSPACAGPWGTTNGTMTYDSWRNAVIMVGQRAGGGQTWKWDGLGWTQVCGASTACAAPDVVSSTRIAFDSARGVVLQHNSNELHEWNGGRWMQVCGGATGCAEPVATSPNLAFDSERDVAVLQGGSSMWEWNGVAWSLVCSGTCGNVFAPDSTAFDVRRERTIGLGFYIGQWDGSRWLESCPSKGGPCTNAPLVFDAPMAYSRDRFISVRHGGYVYSDPGFASDYRYNWKGGFWSSITGGGGIPARYGHAMAYVGTNALVAFGGFDDATYTGTTDGANWTLACTVAPCSTAGNHPSTRFGHVMAWGESNQAWLHGGTSGGTDQADLWRWGSGTWTQFCTAAACLANRPSARSEHAMALDPVRNQLLVFGGGDDELWTWDIGTSAWTLRCGGATACSGPVARSNHLFVFDEQRDKAVLMAGAAESGDCGDGVPYCNDLWEWDPSTAGWTQVCGTGLGCIAPSESGMLTGMRELQSVYDVDRERVVVTSTAAFEWVGAADYRPGQVARFNVSTAGLPSIADCRRTPNYCAIHALSGRWVAGGEGDGANGARLFSFRNGEWTQLTLNAAAPSAPSALTFTTTLPLQVGQAFVGEAPVYLPLAVASRSPNGDRVGYARVVSDTVEATVSYRRAAQFTQLFADDFEAGADPSVWASITGTAAVSSTAARSGISSLDLWANTGEASTAVVDTSACWRIAWSYEGKRGPDVPDTASEGLRLYYRNTSGTWSLVDSLAGPTADARFTTRSGALTATAAFHPAFAMRFTSVGTPECGDCDDVFVDDFEVVCAHD